MKKVKKIVLVLFTLIIVANSFFAKVDAAINTNYYNKSIAGLEVVDATLNDKVENDTLIDKIGSLVYTVGCLMEWLMGSIFMSMTGSNIFPWADAVVFNAIPLLDPNFINPAPNSFLEGIGSIIVRLYGTIFGMATIFFGVAIMITSIKLVLSSIAENKASYKKAIINWLIGLVLLYTIHFLMSFVFYLNEKFVEMASTLVTWDAEMVAIAPNPIEDTELLENFCRVGIDKSIDNNCRDNIINNETNRKITLIVLSDRNLSNFYDRLSSQIILLHGQTIYPVYGTMLDYIIYPIVADNPANFENQTVALEAFLKYVKNFNPNNYLSLLGKLREEYIETMKQIWKLYYEDGSKTQNNLFSNLAQYFKASVWGYEEGGWKADKMVIQNAFLYATFVVQSVIFFVAYIKRLFYIVILGIMAPIVVTYDFVNKK